MYEPKSRGWPQGLANANPSGSAKFANVPPPGLARWANPPQLVLGGGGGAWMHPELTDALFKDVFE